MYLLSWSTQRAPTQELARRQVSLVAQGVRSAGETARSGHFLHLRVSSSRGRSTTGLLHLCLLDWTSSFLTPFSNIDTQVCLPSSLEGACQPWPYFAPWSCWTLPRASAWHLSLCITAARSFEAQHSSLSTNTRKNARR